MSEEIKDRLLYSVYKLVLPILIPTSEQCIWIRTLLVQLNAQASLVVDTCQFALAASGSLLDQRQKGECVECIDCEAEGFLG
jgi:hypothetical protein